MSASLRASAEEAARAAGVGLRAAFRRPMERGSKSSFHDIVTVHDRRAEETIAASLAARYPQSRFIAEEGGEHGDGQLAWIVDPIDGTDNFARGIAFWCVSIAAAVDGEIVASVVYDPIADQLFSADEHGAWLNGRPLSANAAMHEQRATLVTAFPQARDLDAAGGEALESLRDLVEAFVCVRGLGSAALCLAYVAAGWADATFNFGVKIWDVAAGAHLLKRAGGRYVPSSPVTFSSDVADPHYYGVGGEAVYPTLDRVARRIALRYPRPALPPVDCTTHPRNEKSER